MKVQISKLRYFGINTSSSGKSMYRGLKVETILLRNDTLTLFIELALFYDAYLDCEKARLAKVQNTTSILFVFDYKINTDQRALLYLEVEGEG